ncbi:integrase [Kluyvera georgiana ATCC 51603]|uniref:Integrase n=1 Tax=Kluyvera georgiana ATCC 51603 TaxID=1354264 RepID=A0A1B7JXJ3_9ENTR|nr:integrase [Kluyvera georgiana ATCC 51603]
MLTDTKLKHLKNREKNDKIAGRDGLYVLVTPAGSVTFRYDYRINNRRETLTIGRYGSEGINLVEALVLKPMTERVEKVARSQNR